MLDALARDALPLSGAHALGEGVHAVEHLADVGHAVLLAVEDGALLSRRATQRRVQDGAVLGGVDVRSGVHGVAALLEAHGAGEVAEQAEGLLGHEVLGEVEVQVLGVKRELLHAVRIAGEGILEVESGAHELVMVGLEGRPLGRGGCVDGRGNGGHGACSFPGKLQIG